jgi:hypothetical protein
MLERISKRARYEGNFFESIIARKKLASRAVQDRSRQSRRSSNSGQQRQLVVSASGRPGRRAVDRPVLVVDHNGDRPRPHLQRPLRRKKLAGMGPLKTARLYALLPVRSSMTRGSNPLFDKLVPKQKILL